MKRKKSLPRLKRELWKVFSLYIRQRDKWVCYICGRKCEGSAYHASHFISKAIGGLELYFNEKNNHGCCYHCNINLGGNLYEYGMKLGKKTVNELKELRLKTQNVVWDRVKFEKLIKHYKELIKK